MESPLPPLCFYLRQFGLQLPGGWPHISQRDESRKPSSRKQKIPGTNPGGTQQFNRASADNHAAPCRLPALAGGVNMTVTVRKRFVSHP